jgi:hypothetical protein
MVVNSPVKVAQLNADKLDSFDSSEFGQAFASRSNAVVGASLASNTFILAPSFIPDFSGRCLVAVSGQIGFGAASTQAVGPYLRAAIKRGTAAPVNDFASGLYFPPVWGDNVNNRSATQTRVSIFDVKAGEPTQFGAYFGGATGAWIGKPATVTITYHCTTIGSYAGPV